jgi:hypothetical protein
MRGWGGRDRTSIWRSQKRMLLPVREDLKNPFHQDAQTARNNRLSRTVPSSQSPEFWRELGYLETNGQVLPIRSPRLRSEITANTGLILPTCRPREQPDAVKLAERVGFEPTVRFPAHTLSKRAP